MATTGNYTMSWSGMQLTPTKGDTPIEAPSGLMVTRAVETKAGWVGQVLVDQEIVHETEPWKSEGADTDRDDRTNAVQEVNAYVVGRMKWLFGPDFDAEEVMGEPNG